MKSNLLKRGFVGLSATQILGAANDNVLKGVLTFAVVSEGVWDGQLGEAGQAWVGLCLTLPFILLSGIAGQVADRFSKARVTVVIKFVEVLIALVALLGFWMGDVWVTLVAMLMLGAQSAFFGPAKYGMIPEIVRAGELSRANGVINMCTNVAIIAGTLVAGPVYQAFHPESDPVAVSAGTVGEARQWIPGVVMLAIAASGVLTALCIPRLVAQRPQLSFALDLTHTYRRALREMAGTQLLRVALAWSFFYMIGMMALLILPEYKSLLGISPTEASYLLGILGLAIGLGSVTAGIISGRHIEPRLIPVGAVGMTTMFLLLGTLPLNYWLVAALLLGAGLFAGLYIVPLQSMLQFLSPDDERGRFLGTANALSFVCSTTGIGIYMLAVEFGGLQPNRVFLICGFLAMIGAGVLIIWMRRLIVHVASFRTLSGVPDRCLNCDYDLAERDVGSERCPKCGVHYGQ